MEHVKAYVFENPLPGIEPRIVYAKIGAPVRDIVAGARAPMVCIINGQPLKRDYWLQRDIYADDVIEFHPVYLGGNNNSSSILGAIAMIVVSYFAPYMAVGMAGSAAGTVGNLTALGRVIAAGIVLVGSALISAILPKPNARGSGLDGDRASSIYSVDTQGNQAKVFSPIPVQYGRVKAFPDYAAQPYTRYETSTSADGDQYYHALFCIGQGEYNIEAITIADAPISSFQDVIVSRILPPGHLPQAVNPLIVTSDAVAGNSLDAGDFIGGFPCCGAGKRAKVISLDFVFPSGLCKLDNKGKAKWLAITIIADIAPLDDNNNIAGGWQTVVYQDIGAASLTPQRRTIDFAVAPGRYMVRVRRIGRRDPSDNYTMNACQWAAMRAELEGHAPLCKTATHYELVMRASEQLSSLSQRKIGVLCTRKIRDFDGNLVPSRNPMLALLDKWRSADYGDNLPLERVDIPTLRKYAKLADEREDFFDYRFESRMTSEEADQLISKVHRCAALQRYGVKTVVRDELVDLPITMFNPTNITEGSVSLDYVQITEETGDGVIVEYFSEITNLWEEEECPAPGRTYTTSAHAGYNPRLPPMDNPVRLQLAGISRKNHAIREGMYYAATNSLRRQFISWQTEMQGILVYYGAPVLFASTLYNSGGGGEILDRREEDGALKLSGPIAPGQKIMFMDAAGGVSQPFSVQILPDGWIIPPQALGFGFGGFDAERGRYALLDGNITRRLVKLTRLEPRGMGNNGAPEYQLRGVVDVPEVHTCDNAWLPRGFAPPAVSSPMPVFAPHNITTESATWAGSGYPAALIFYPDGRAAGKYYTRSRGIIEDDEGVTNWINDAPVQNIGGDYEIGLAFYLPEYLAKFLWLGATAPADNMILQGHRCNVYGGANIQAADNATQSLFAAITRGAQEEAPVYMTAWRSMAQRLEFSGGYNEMTVEGGALTGLREFSGVYGIRDRASKVFQGYGRFALVNTGAK